MTLPEITLVIGIDFKTVQQLEVSHRTWKKFQSHMYRWPWICFYDGCCPAFTNHSLNDLVKREVVPEQTRFVPWPQCIGGNSRTPHYESQRERMLTGHIFVPALHVQTPYFCKLDTDAIAARECEWPKAEWFENLPQVVAPAWNYSKGQNFLGRLEEWGDKTRMKEKPRLNIPFDPTHLRVPHKRWCSWNSFYETGFVKLFLGLLHESGIDKGTLPVPSQDTCLWYAGERLGVTVNKVNMKKHGGFTNIPKLANLIEQVQSIMRGEEQAAITDG